LIQPVLLPLILFVGTGLQPVGGNPAYGSRNHKNPEQQEDGTEQTHHKPLMNQTATVA
jgi:hypothetical protein